ncbi:MAG: phage holin family protein [Candidatus Peregrinibacteria bacterium]|nr:phage holin family protein [Candidatus Peregrinibacteria bacterium]MDZ4245097.1 phage holin family protein [Candidatus Gracilibacteria bacterium]
MLRKLILGILLNTLAFYAVTKVVPQVTYEGGWGLLIFTGALLGFLNAFIKPVIKVFSFPIIFLSGGLFLVVINAAILWLLVNLFDVLAINEFNIIMAGGGVTYLYAGAVFGVINWLEHWLFKR